MKKVYAILFSILFVGILVNNSKAQEKSQKKSNEKTTMHRYVVERTFPNGLNIPINEVGKDMCLNVVTNNAEDQVTWVQSYVSEDKKKTFCIYDAPSKDAIKKAAKVNKYRLIR